MAHASSVNEVEAIGWIGVFPAPEAGRIFDVQDARVPGDGVCPVWKWSLSPSSGKVGRCPGGA